MKTSNKRDRGILSEKDRAYLCGESDIEASSASERVTRQRIRERVYNAILDFSILFEHLEERDREQIFDPPLTERDRFEDGLRDGIAMLYLGVADERWFERLLREGIKTGARHDEELEHILFDITVEVDVERTTTTPDALIKKLEDGDVIDPNEIAMMLDKEMIDPDELIKILQSRRE